MSLRETLEPTSIRLLPSVVNNLKRMARFLSYHLQSDISHVDLIRDMISSQYSHPHFSEPGEDASELEETMLSLYRVMNTEANMESIAQQKNKSRAVDDYLNMEQRLRAHRESDNHNPPKCVMPVAKANLGPSPYKFNVESPHSPTVRNAEEVDLGSGFTLGEKVTYGSMIAIAEDAKIDSLLPANTNNRFIENRYSNDIIMPEESERDIIAHAEILKSSRTDVHDKRR